MSATCPNCKTALKPADLDSGWCDNCGKKIPAYVLAAAKSGLGSEDPPFAPDPAASTTEAQAGPTPQRLRFRRWIALILLASPFMGLGLYSWLKPDVEIYLDNGGARPLTLFLGGSEVLTVPAGKVEKASCRSGRRQITVKDGNRTVFDEVKELEGGRRAPRKYLLNPEAAQRYWVREVRYGLAVPEFITYRDDLDRYGKTARQLDLVPVGAWVDVRPDLVLEPAPEQVKGQFSDSRKVLTRISAAEYALIAGAREKREVSSEELNRLEGLVDRLLKTGN